MLLMYQRKVMTRTCECIEEYPTLKAPLSVSEDDDVPDIVFVQLYECNIVILMVENVKVVKNVDRSVKSKVESQCSASLIFYNFL